MSVAVSDIITRSLVIADLQNAAYITQYDQHAAANEGYRYLYNLLLNNDDDYYVTEVTPTVTSAYTFPADFERLRAVDVLIASGIYVPVEKYTMQQRDSMDNVQTLTPMYREFNNTLRIIPQAQSFQLRIWYYPVPNVLVSSTVQAWVTLTAYVQGQMLTNSGSVYVCLVNHTSGTFATDLAAGYWSLYATSYTSTISYPNNLVYEIISYRAAILYRIKHKAQGNLLQELRIELAKFEEQFLTMIIRDDYQNQKLNDVWGKRHIWL